MRKELDAINAELASNDGDAAHAASTSAADLGPVETPSEQSLDATSSKKEGTKKGSSIKTDPASELARRESELDRKEKELWDVFRATEQGMGFLQKRAELEEKLTREQEDHKLKLHNIQTDSDAGKQLSEETVKIMKTEIAKRNQEVYRELLSLGLVQLREAESGYLLKISLLEEREALVVEKYAGDTTALQQAMMRSREDMQLAQKGLQETRELIRFKEENVKSVDKVLDAINAELSIKDKNSSGITTITTTTADPGLVKMPAKPLPADNLLSTSVVTDNPPSATAASPPSESQKVLSPLDEMMKKEEEQEKQEVEGKEKKEAEERKAAFDEAVREKQADFKRKKGVIENLVGKLHALNHKVREMGIVAADGITVRTDLTKEERLIVDPIATTILKYQKLQRSLSRDHDIKKCELDIEIAKFDKSELEESMTLTIRKIDIKLESALTEGNCDAERDEEQVRVYQDNLVKLLYNVNDSNSQLALLEQRLLEIVAEGDGDGLVLAPPKQPPHVLPSVAPAVVTTTATEGTSIK